MSGGRDRNGLLTACSPKEWDLGSSQGTRSSGGAACLGRRNAPLQKDNAFIETGALQNMDGALDLMGVF